ncbi:FixH family protein [Candidatus Electronema sp. TJ]|uniref:FixH family protein n=1 Tax=Candidatus Electronema sp. TJ TaxID=3401573 RepID=UPI003AA9A695
MPALCRRLFQLVLLTAFVLAAALPVRAEEPKYEPLPGEGKTCKIGSSDYSFVYKFDKKPQLGVSILKLQVTDKAGGQVTALKITGDSGMPSMRGHHDSGPVEFKLNKKGDYLLPVDVVMPGGWDVRLEFSKDGQVIYRGSINFDV